jgi:HlyD family secretion protein
VKRSLYRVGSITLVVSLALALGFKLTHRQVDQPREVAVKIGTIDYRIAAYGRTEGISEELKPGSKVAGRIKSIPVEEGEAIKKYQVLATLENDDYRARLDQSRAQVRKAEAQLELVRNGARLEEREDIRAMVRRAEAVVANAETNYQRFQTLYQQQIVAKAQVDQADRDLKTAQADLESARQKYKLITSAPRYEDVKSAQAELEAAKAKLREDELAFENTFIRSPINGIVVKKYMKEGESITFQSVSMPLLSISDNSRILVRAEIDESDVSKIGIGQPALVTADAYRSETFTGKVVRISGGLGRKQVKSDNPSEKVDTEILEAIIKLDPGAEAKLKLGLRVEVIIRVAYKNQVLILPSKAIQRRGVESFVRLKEGQNWVERRVETGVWDLSHVEIKKGVEVNDIVGY